MKNISKIILVMFLFLGLVLSGCDKRKDVERAKVSFDGMNNAEVMSEGKYPYLDNLLGHITYKQLLELLDGSMQTLNALADQGYTSREDYQTLLNILTNTYSMMLEDKAEYEANGAENTTMSEASQALIALIEMAEKNGVGLVLNQIIARTGPEILRENVYPMLTYVLAADDETLKGTTGGVTIGEIKRDDFYTLMEVMNGLLDPHGKYGDIHGKLGATINAVKANEIKNLTYKDTKDLLDALLHAFNQNEGGNGVNASIDAELLDAIAKVLGELWDTDPQFRQDLKDILYSAGLLMSNEIPMGGDTDFGRILIATEQLLAPGKRAHLKEFVTSALHGLAPASDGETLAGLIEAISGVDTNNDGFMEEMNTYPEGIDRGLIQTLRYNMYHQDRTALEPNDVHTSSLRALMYMMQEANFIPPLLGVPQLSLVKSPQGSTVADDIKYPDKYTYNMAEWSIGEVVTALEWAENGNPYLVQDYNGNGRIDDFDTFYWVLYEKQYKMLGGLISFDGLAGMIVGLTSNPLLKGLLPPGVTDPFPAFVDLAGCSSFTGDYTESTWQSENTNINPGSRHQLFALFAPLMKYFWDAGRSQDMIMLLALMNEIDCDPKLNPYITYSKPYAALKNGSNQNPNATFRKDDSGDIMQTIEGKNGDGLLSYALRSHTTLNEEDGILLDKLLNILVKVVFKLDSSEYSNGESLFNALLRELNITKMEEADINDLVTLLFDGKDGNQPLIETAYKLVHNNHDALVAIGKPMGELLVALGDAHTSTLDSMIADVRKVIPILTDLVDFNSEENTLGDLLDYLTTENADGSDNPFIKNMKIIATRLLDVKDSDYNPNGFVTDDTPITGPNGMLDHLLGDANNKGYYDFQPLMDLLRDATGSPDILWAIVDDGGAMFDKVIGDEELSLKFVRSLFTPVDTNLDGKLEDAVVYRMLDIMHLEQADMQGVLGDVAALLSGTDLKPGSAMFDQLLKILDFVVKGTTVQ
jgi:hypothetical protein